MEKDKAEMLLSKDLTIVVLPAPEGAENIITFPSISFF
tara:strand:+ start:60 stop:173 length:114 start_codon:yes stop_codon:yes gene_type:complete